MLGNTSIAVFPLFIKLTHCFIINLSYLEPFFQDEQEKDCIGKQFEASFSSGQLFIFPYPT